MTTVSVRLSPRELDALHYLCAQYGRRSKSNQLRKLILDAAKAAGYGELAARPARRRT